MHTTVPPGSLKLRLSYFKTELCGAVSNLVTRSHMHVREVDEGVWGGIARVRAVVFRFAVIIANGEGGMRWSELIVEAACGGWRRWW
jgi:hypothetical protein